MHKEEVIQLHRVLYLISQYLREMGIVTEMPEYERLLVRPFHVNKAREEHVIASLVLSKELLENILKNGDNGSDDEHELYIAIKALENIIIKKKKEISKKS